MLPSRTIGQDVVPEGTGRNSCRLGEESAPCISQAGRSGEVREEEVSAQHHKQCPPPVKTHLCGSCMGCMDRALRAPPAERETSNS